MKVDYTMKNIWKVASKQKAVLAIFALIFIMMFFETQFFTVYNWMNMLRSVAILEIIGMGVTIAVLCFGCDLSVGGTMSLGGVVAVLMINMGIPIVLAFLGGMLTGALVGFVNGFLVVHQKTEPFIITLGMGLLLKGISQQLTDAHPLPSKNESFVTIANSKLVGIIPSLVIYMLILLILFYCLMRFTSYGRNCYAIGGNYDVAKYSGINVVVTKWSAFVISGTVAALAGVLLSSRMATASSVYGDNTGMLVNCGVVIGGTSFAGGIGGIVQSFIGIFVMQLLTNCMDSLGIGSYIQQLLLGILIVTIIGLDCFGRMLKKKRV